MSGSSAEAKSSADIIVMHSVVSYALALILDGIHAVGGKPIKNDFSGHRNLVPLLSDDDERSRCDSRCPSSCAPSMFCS
jgi:hypothetical protein